MRTRLIVILAAMAVASLAGCGDSSGRTTSQPSSARGAAPTDQSPASTSPAPSSGTSTAVSPTTTTTASSSSSASTTVPRGSIRDFDFENAVWSTPTETGKLSNLTRSLLFASVGKAVFGDLDGDGVEDAAVSVLDQSGTSVWVWLGSADGEPEQIVPEVRQFPRCFDELDGFNITDHQLRLQWRAKTAAERQNGSCAVPGTVRATASYVLGQDGLMHREP